MDPRRVGGGPGQQALREAQDGLDVGDVRHEAQRDAHGAGRLAADAEEVALPRSDLIPGVRELGLVDSQIGERHRQAGHPGAAGLGELADPVDRVVAVEGQRVVVARPDGAARSDELERPAGRGAPVTLTPPGTSAGASGARSSA